MVTTKQFADVLRNLEDNAELTKEFENIKDKDKNRIYGQKDRRWWDKNTGSQKEHVVCWFARKYYKNGSAIECKNENYPLNCKECFLCSEEKYMNENCGYQKDAKIVYNKMSRPEMYIWIIEVLGVLEDKNELCKIIDDIKRKMDEMKGKPHNTIMKAAREIIESFVKWETIEEKVNVMKNMSNIPESLLELDEGVMKQD